MTEVKTDKIKHVSFDRKLLRLLQVKFPLSREPYADLGMELGINQDEVIQRIKQLRELEIVRQISPVLDARRLGYQPTLVAMRVDEAYLERAEKIIIAHPGISHGYERDHHLNLWFTLAIPGDADVDSDLKQIARSIRAKASFLLPAIKVFKIGAFFALDGHAMNNPGTKLYQPFIEPAELSTMDRLIINELQQDLPLVHTPFSEMAARLDIDEDRFLANCRSLKQRGVIRRFGAAVNHRKAGFKANAMTCWTAPEEKVIEAGRMLGQINEVSHCYERKTNPQWQYNLFAMIHGRDRETCQEIAGMISARMGLTDYVMLFSTREFKKTRIKYLV
jgi:DNA-binding Lrp family transcriptional regulator